MSANSCAPSRRPSGTFAVLRRRLSPISALVLALMCFAPILPCARAQAAEGERDFPTVHRAAQADLAAGMLELAGWCNDKELFGERDRLYRAILDFDPDNVGARKGLRYSRKSDGSWQEPAPREAKNRNPKALPELAEKRAGMVEPFKTAMLAALDEFAADAATRSKVYDEILGADPDDAFVRKERGEARLGERWVLAESAVAHAKRAEIAALVKTAQTDVGKPRPEPLTDVEKKLGLKFTQALRTSDVRVLGTGKAPECEAAVRNCQVVRALLHGLFGMETPFQEGFTVYLLAEEKQGPIFVAQIPGLDDAFRDTLKRCTGAFLPGQPIVAYWDHDVAHRVDGASRQTIGDFLGRSYGLKLANGWAWEGTGLYLNHAVCGTRLTWFAQMPNATTTQKALFKKLQNPETDWYAEALTVLEGDTSPRFETTLDRGVDKMTVEDVLCAHAIAAWLVEGRTADVVPILERIGTGGHPTAKAFEEVLHLTPAEVQARVTRWLGERE